MHKTTVNISLECRSSFNSWDFSTLLIYLALLPALPALAEDYVSADQSIDNPTKIPAPIIAYLAKEVDSDYTECKEEGLTLSENLEAKKVKLNSFVEALVIKPTSTCFCSSYACPMWVFANINNNAKIIFDSPLAGHLVFMDKKTNGYPDITVSGGLLTHGYEARYKWDGKEYQEVYNQVWIRNSGRDCNEAEIEELKDGKWLKTSNVCLPDE